MFTYFHRKHLVSFLIVIITCTLGFSLLVREGHVLAAPSASPAAISLSKIAVPPTSNLKVSGTGFGASETVVVMFDTTQVGTASTDSSGAFSARITVPASATPGKHFIKATGSTSGLSAKAFFRVRTNWAMSGFDPQQDDANPYENVLNTSNVSTLAQDWSQTFQGTTSVDSPAIYDGIVYEGAAKFYAFDASTGSLIWTYPIASDSDPAVANDIVYIAADQLYALQAKTGKLLWSASSGGSYLSSPVVANGVVYAGAQNSNLYAFNATTGSLIWSTKTAGIIYGEPAVAGGMVYACSTGILYAFDAQSGKLRWKATIGQEISSPVIAEGIVYASASSGTLFALKATTGKLIWAAPISEPTQDALPPAVANGVVYLAGNYLYAFNAQTGTQIWSLITNDIPAAPPTIANGIIYLSEGFSPGGISAIDVTTGKTLWGVGQNELSYSSPIVVNGLLYVGAGTGYPNYTGYLYTYHLPSAAA